MIRHWKTFASVTNGSLLKRNLKLKNYIHYIDNFGIIIKAHFSISLTSLTAVKVCFTL